MKRLLLLTLAGVAFATTVTPAQATIVTCGLPVQPNCFYWNGSGYVHCDLWVAGWCMQLDHIGVGVES